MTHRRKKNTGTVFRRGEWFIGLAPQHTRGCKQLRVAKEKTYSAAAVALDAWLKRAGRIVWKGPIHG